MLLPFYNKHINNQNMGYRINIDLINLLYISLNNTVFKQLFLNSCFYQYETPLTEKSEGTSDLTCI